MHNKKAPSILYIITKLELGGAQKICLSLFKNNKKNYLFTGAEGILLSKVIKNPRVTVFKHFVREVSFTSFFKELKNFKDLIIKIKTLKKSHPNLIVHTHSTKAGIIGRWAALCAGIKNKVHTVHGFGFHDYQARSSWLLHFTLEWLTALITTRYICVSQKDAQYGSAHLPFFKKNHTLIRAAVDDTFFIPSIKRDYSTQPFIIGTLSCFKPQKNLHDLLNAFLQTHQEYPYIHLMIIGDGYQRLEIETWIVKNNLTSVITLLGWQSDVKKHMLGWNTFALSSLWEGLPCAVIEARLMKLPVVSYDVGGIAEIIHHEKNGLVCPVKNTQMLKNAFIRLIQNKSFYKKLSEHNEDLSAFAQASMLKQHKHLYKSLHKTS